MKFSTDCLNVKFVKKETSCRPEAWWILSGKQQRTSELMLEWRLSRWTQPGVGTSHRATFWGVGDPDLPDWVSSSLVLKWWCSVSPDYTGASGQLLPAVILWSGLCRELQMRRFTDHIQNSVPNDSDVMEKTQDCRCHCVTPLCFLTRIYKKSPKTL